MSAQVEPQKVACIAGVGPGLGRAIARRFANEGYRVAILARNRESLNEIAAANPALLHPMSVDVTNPVGVAQAVAEIEHSYGPIDAAVYNVGAFRPGSILDTTPEDFELCWRVGAFGGFLFGQAVARSMVARGAGTIIFTGATASLRGSGKFQNLASPKFALRALAQSMARELGPQGVHVAHVIIDGVMRQERFAHLIEERGSDALMDQSAVAEIYWQLHKQPRNAWTHEIDVRPCVEKW